MDARSLSSFYLQQILPRLFDRLDQAFPEFEWTRTAHGWSALRRTTNGFGGHAFSSRSTANHEPPSQSPRMIVCHHPWGFEDGRGGVQSWLTYLNSGRRVEAHEFASGVRRLARLAGVEHQMPSHVDAEEERQAWRDERRREIIEAFAAYCHAALCDHRGADLRRILQQEHHIATEDLGGLPVGMVTSPEDVADHLTRAGFTRDEITESWLVGDPRISGRLVVPWRDHCGTVATVLARNIGSGGQHSNDLYLTSGQKPAGFGLDEALRSGGQKDLILVDSILDVLAWRSRGVRHVATLTTRGAIDVDQWELIGTMGVESVTLAIDATMRTQERGFAFSHDAESFKRSPFGSRASSGSAPPFGSTAALGSMAFGTDSSSASTSPSAARSALASRSLVVRSDATLASIHHWNRAVHGPDLFVADEVSASTRESQRGIGRVHAFQFMASRFLSKHQPTSGWTEQASLDLMRDAVQFDADVTAHEKKLAMDRYFWPAIREAVGVKWEYLWQLVKSPQPQPQPLPQRETRHERGRWTVHNLREFVVLLSSQLDRQDVPACKQLIWDAADDLRQTDGEHRRFFVEPNRRWEENATPVFVPAERRAYDVVRPPKPLPSSVDIRELAYRLWEQKGRPEGADEQCWYEAEQSLRTRAA